MKRGKAAGLDSITAEHLQYSHPLVACVLAKLFNGMVKFWIYAICLWTH